MRINHLSIIILSSLISCSQKKESPEQLNKRLVSFTVTSLEEDKDIGTNQQSSIVRKINDKKETIVLEYRKKLYNDIFNYEGSLSLSNDTLYVQIENIFRTRNSDSVDTKVEYEIWTNGLKYNKIIFKEIF